MPKRVLVIEDDDAGRTLVSEILREAGFEVKAVVSASTALQYLETARPDGMILDLVMPEVDGMDFLMQARKLPCAAGVPIIVLSAAAFMGDLLVGTVGVRAALAKPFELDELLAVVKRVFSDPGELIND